MKLFSHPVLKFRTKDRLHISKEPGLLSWVALFSINISGVVVDYFVIPDHFLLHAGFLLLCLILSLNLMKTWDLIMDGEENLGTMIHRNWYHVFSIRVPEENVERFPLTSITSVVVTCDSVDIIRRDGSSTKIISDSSNYSLLKNLRKEISTFLCLERIEHLKDTDKIFYDWDVDPWASVLSNSESQESDNENQESIQMQEESQFQYGSNIKIITAFAFMENIPQVFSPSICLHFYVFICFVWAAIKLHKSFVNNRKKMYQ